VANGQLGDALRDAQEARLRAEMDREIALAAESRSLAQLSDSREELKRGHQLMEHLHRIESGLQGRAESEKEQALSERDQLAKSYELLRQTMDDKVVLLEQRLRAQDEELRALRNKCEQRSAEAASLREQLTQEHCSAVSAQQRSELLERQLNVFQERLASAQGGVLVEALYQQDLAAKDKELQRALADLALVKEQLATSDSHLQQLRAISAATEATLNQLRKKFSDASGSSEQEISRLNSELQQEKNELAVQRQQTGELLQECEQSREQIRLLTVAHMEELRALKAQLAEANQEKQDLLTQLSVLQSDAARFQQTAKQAFANYERELHMHALAERSLLDSQEALEALKQKHSESEHRAASLSSDMIRMEKLRDEEKQVAAKEISGLREQLVEIGRTNELLHSQVQTYGAQIERMQESRLVQGEIAMNSSGGEQLEDVEQQRKALHELREVLRFMKKEKDMLLAKLSVVESENSRHVMEVARLTKQLDETRQSLKRELDAKQSSYAARSEEEFNRLLGEVQQLNLVRESNAHLRADNDELYKKLQVVNEELRVVREAAGPIQNEMRKLRADKDALDLVNDQLTNDVGYWRDRLQNMVSRYNDVDPEEHRLLKLKLEEMTVAEAETSKKLQATTEELAERSNELKSKVANNQVLEKSAESLRNIARKLQAQLTEASKELEVATARCDSLTAQLEDANKELEVARGSAAEANQQVLQLQLQQKLHKEQQEKLKEQREQHRQLQLQKQQQAQEAAANAVTTIAADAAPTIPVVVPSTVTSAPMVKGAFPPTDSNPNNENEIKRRLQEKFLLQASATAESSNVSSVGSSTVVPVSDSLPPTAKRPFPASGQGPPPTKRSRPEAAAATVITSADGELEEVGESQVKTDTGMESEPIITKTAPTAVPTPEGVAIETPAPAPWAVRGLGFNPFSQAHTQQPAPTQSQTQGLAEEGEVPESSPATIFSSSIINIGKQAPPTTSRPALPVSQSLFGRKPTAVDTRPPAPTTLPPAPVEEPIASEDTIRVLSGTSKAEQERMAARSARFNQPDPSTAASASSITSTQQRTGPKQRVNAAVLARSLADTLTPATTASASTITASQPTTTAATTASATQPLVEADIATELAPGAEELEARGNSEINAVTEPTAEETKE